MRVAHVLTGWPDLDACNGVFRTVHELSREQARTDGTTVAVFAATRSNRDDESSGIVRAYPLAINPFRLSPRLSADLEAWAPDILHLHLAYAPLNAAVSAWARQRGIPYVVTPHGSVAPGELSHRRALKLPYKFLFERRILNGACFVHGLGAHEELVRYGVRPPVVVIPNGIDLAPYAGKPPDGTYLTERHPELSGRRIFLYVGRFDPKQKGLDVLLKAAPALDAKSSALVLMGPNWRGFQPRIERIARSVGRAPVVILGPVTGRDKIEALAAADVFVHPSRWEGLPHAVLEAAAMRLPALLSPPADPLGRFGECGAAIHVEADVDSIARGLRQFADMSASELKSRGEKARALVEAEFGWRRVVAVMNAAYARYGKRIG